MAYSSGSEDEFPDVNMIVQKYQVKVQGNREGGSGSSRSSSRSSNSKETVSATEFSSKTARNSRMREQAEPDLPSAATGKATPLRRRKLGQVQTKDDSLFKPWTKLDGDRGTGSGVIKSKASRVRSREESADFKLNSVREVSDRLPPRTREAKSTTHFSSEEPNDSPEQPKRSRRLVSRGALKLKRSGSTEVEKSEATSSESEAESEEPEEDLEPSDDGLSDFIVSSDSETEEEDSNSDSDIFVTPPTRRSKSPSGSRQKHLKLLPSSKEPTKNDTRSRGRTTNSDQPKVTDPIKRPSRQSAEDRTESKTAKEKPKKNLEDAFQKLQIFNEESDSDDTKVKSNKNRTIEPSTPRKTKLPASPSKGPSIPESPWKPENIEFWDPEVNFAWIDKHSPPKRGNPEGKKKLDLTGGMPDSSTKAEMKRRYGNSPEKRDAKKAFDAIKESLARDFLQELDKRITDGRLAQMTEATGGLRIVWSKTLLTTAGRAHWKCKTVTTMTSSRNKGAPDAGGVPTTTATTTQHQHQASIELASKVLANRADLLNTVAHEFCHLAVFMLDGGKPKSAHGPEFKAWGRRCGAAFADRGIEVTTKHSYEIEYKYIWRCAGCAIEVKRHSKSVDPARQRCGACLGVLVQVKPTPRGGGGSGVDGGDKDGPVVGGGAGMAEGGLQKTKKKQSAWQEFMAKEMKVLTQTNKGMSLKDRMAIVSARWQEQQKTVKSLASAVEVLEIDGDSDESAKGKGKETSKVTATAGYDLFA
ncbi:SprT-like family-domain-containing protein [Biscogniauxia sp. FL1348]|nr:SprT-like family-domain-containing protein [Biscogniauxia sp. FL1348]